MADSVGPEADASAVSCEVERGVARLTLARARSRNALTDQICLELLDHLQAIERSDEIEVVVLSGEGPVFCAGGNTKVPTLLASSQASVRRRMADRWAEVFHRMHSLAQPSVARLSGAAIGGGALLALACDLRVADHTFVFGLPETSMGQYLMGGGVARLVNELGAPRARDLLLTGRMLTAEEAESWGVVSRLVESAELDAQLAEVVGSLLASPHETSARVRRSVQAVGSMNVSWPDEFLATDG